MKKLWHLWILLSLGLISLLTGIFVCLGTGDSLKDQLADANKQSITKYIGFNNTDDPNSISTSTISKISNPFFLASYGVTRIWDAQFYEYNSGATTQNPVENNTLQIYKVGLFCLLVIGPVFFGGLVLDALFYILYLDHNIRKYSQVESSINRNLNKKAKKAFDVHQSTTDQKHLQRVNHEKEHLQNLISKISQSEASRKALYVGNYDFKFIPERSVNSLRFQANEKDDIVRNYKSLVEGKTFVFRNKVYQFIKAEVFTIYKTDFVQILAKNINSNDLATIVIGEEKVKGDWSRVK